MSCFVNAVGVANVRSQKWHVIVATPEIDQFKIDSTFCRSCDQNMARVCDLVAVAVLCVLASCTVQLSAAASVAQQSNNSRPNVLFLVVDDLRPELTAYRVKGVDLPTPNIDRVAAKALLFQHAYAQQAVCGPSRNSFMTGRRPDVTKTWNFIDNFREKGVGADWVTLPQHFLKDNGYLVTGWVRSR